MFPSPYSSPPYFLSKVQLPLQHRLVSAVLRRGRIAREYNKGGGRGGGGGGGGEGEEEGEEEGESKYTERPHTHPSSLRLTTEEAPLSVRVISAKDEGDTLEVVFSKVCFLNGFIGFVKQERERAFDMEVEMCVVWCPFLV